MSSSERRARLPVVVLGATGLVGQRLVALLARHPWFRVAGVASSGRRAGARYGEAARWIAGGDLPEEVADLPITPAEPGHVEASVVFSALPAAEAETIEPAFAQAGAVVFTNASAYRLALDVPLIIPEINPEHLAAVAAQRARRGWRGAIIANPNCSTTGLALALAPLAPLGVRSVLVTTLQAASGAGYPGVAALDLVDNAIPYIAGEEEKLETETAKILGGWTGSAFAPAALRVSAQCTRVAVREGHLECVSVGLDQPASVEDALDRWRRFTGEPQRLRLPSAPRHPLRYRDEPDRPQPLWDRDAEHGMAVTLGRLRPCPVLDLKFICLSHNTLRGAAGAAVLNAELAYARGLLEGIAP